MGEEGSRNLLRKRWWREEGELGLWLLWSLGCLGGGVVKWEVRRRLEGEKVTVAEILGMGVGEEEEEEGGVLGLGAKKREITCCFCFPIWTLVMTDE